MSITPQNAITRQTTTALEINPAATYDEWLETGRTLLRIEGALQWYIGDWLVYGERNFPTYTQALADLDLSDSQIEAYKKRVWVSAAIPPRRRHEALTFGHHESVASCEPAMADSLLRWAIEENATVRGIRAERRARTGEAIPATITQTLTGDRESLYNALEDGRTYKLTYTLLEE